MSTEKIVEKIPDVYFDWYARLIPGVIALCYYFYRNQDKFSNTTSALLIYLFIAYILGHLIQPISSKSVECLQKIITTDEDRYKLAKQSTDYASITAKVSKAYAEAVGMFSTFLLLLLTHLYMYYADIVWCLLLPYLLLATLERTCSRKKKISDLPESPLVKKLQSENVAPDKAGEETK